MSRVRRNRPSDAAVSAEVVPHRCHCYSPRMDRSNLERLVALGVSLTREEAVGNTEFQALNAALRADSEERERNKPENIRAEITQCLEHACCRYLPARFDQRDVHAPNNSVFAQACTVG